MHSDMQIPLSLFDIAIASGLLALVVMVAWRMQLGNGKTIVIAGIRTVVQLSLIGWVLVYIFANQQWYAVLPILSIMILIAGSTAKKRIKRPYIGLTQDILLAIAIPSGLITLFTMLLILQIDPWYKPQYIIPFLGLLLGNSLTAISLTCERLINSFYEKQLLIESKQSLSASQSEVCQEFVQSAINQGMLPTINSMMVVGLVSLPGMMTGQILAGADPSQAARYQILTMFVICANTFFSCLLACRLIIRRFFNQWQQLVLPTIKPNK